MEQGTRPPKKHLSFSALKSCIDEHINHIPDLRQEGKRTYKISDCYMSGFALFYLQDPSVLEFQRRFEDQIHMNNLTNVFGIANIPGDAQLRNILDTHSYDALLNIFPDFFRRMQRNKSLDQFQFLDGKYLIAMDGSEYFTSEKIHCAKCLVTESNGVKRYHHQILQATVVHPDMRQVIPLAPEFIYRCESIRPIVNCK